METKTPHACAKRHFHTLSIAQARDWPPQQKWLRHFLGHLLWCPCAWLSFLTKIKQCFKWFWKNSNGFQMVLTTTWAPLEHQTKPFATIWKNQMVANGVKRWKHQIWLFEHRLHHLIGKSKFFHNGATSSLAKSTKKGFCATPFCTAWKSRFRTFDLINDFLLRCFSHWEIFNAKWAFFKNLKWWHFH